MARMSIYVSDRLKEEIDQIGDGINWSNAAQTAFFDAIRRHSRMGVTTMDTLIERIKLSKAGYEAEQKQYGEERGALWAVEEAEYIDLKRISSAIKSGTLSSNATNLANKISDVLRIDDPELHPGWDEDLRSFDGESDEFWRAWLSGVENVWNQIAEKL